MMKKKKPTKKDQERLLFCQEIISDEGRKKTRNESKCWLLSTHNFQQQASKQGGKPTVWDSRRDEEMLSAFET